MFSPDEYDGTGDLPDRLAFVKPDRARLWIDLHDRDDVPTAATLVDGHDVSTATIYRMLEDLAELGLAENVSTYRDGRATTGFRALEPGADTSREIFADGSGPVFENGRATTCPDCGGDLQYQNRQSILCLGCEQDFEHWKNASSHHLIEVDAHTGRSEIVESTPRDVETDGGQSSNGPEQSRQLRILRSEDDSHHYECPDCGDWVAEWQDCPHCGWYDGAAWKAAVKRRETGAPIAAANPIKLEEIR